ncbi:unnamed protein product [Arabis nemorensis]|uniref:Replication factor A C-terminal domain-containing protein n=1 Tax=Arabis nemorensis TaxID=586526 RepID=A0A565BJ10_9BRAS|nr:unnamed protein product [Arabis nemorensis]
MTQRKQCSVVITTVNRKMFAGDLYLNTLPATRFYQHDEPQEVESVRHQYENIQTSSLQEHELNEESSSLKTISQMLSFLDVAKPQEKEFICSARIVDIITRNGWYNISCAKCYYRIKPLDDKLICRFCDDSSFIGVVRFRLEVIVDDETDQGRFVIFDREARKLTNMLAGDLITFKGATS